MHAFPRPIPNQQVPFVLVSRHKDRRQGVHAGGIGYRRRASRGVSESALRRMFRGADSDSELPVDMRLSAGPALLTMPAGSVAVEVSQLLKPTCYRAWKEREHGSRSIRGRKRQRFSIWVPSGPSSTYPVLVLQPEQYRVTSLRDWY